MRGLGQKRCSSPAALSMIPLNQNPSSNSRVKGTVVLEPTIMTTGDSWLPHPACAFVGVEHSLKGTLLLEPGGSARRLEPNEVARAEGVLEDQYDQEIQKHGRSAAHLHLARESGWQYSAAVIAYVEASFQTSTKVGNCIDPADTEAYARLAVWLQAWRLTPQDPKNHLKLVSRHTARQPATEEPSAHASTEIRCGGSAPNFDSLKHRDLVQPAFQDSSQVRKNPSMRFRSLNELDRLGQEAVMSKLADSTRKAYSTGWKQWELFMSGTTHSPFLAGETRAEKQLDEAWLIRFVVFLHEVMGRTAQGIKQRLSAVRYAHIAAGYPDPLQGRVRLWASLQGLARWEGPSKEGSRYSCYAFVAPSVS